jgi:hypothetical protein
MTARARTSPVTVTLAIAGDSALPEPVANTLGEVTVGPRGFLTLLENRLGIPSADASFTTRLIQYLACMDELDHAQAFYRDSYEADPFSVARTLLQWRDQWYLAGWRGQFAPGAPGRLADMAALESLAAGAVEPGLGQRVQRVLDLLPDNPVALGGITLRDDLADFPHLWRQLVAATGAPLTEPPQPIALAAPDSDLHRLQEHLLQGGGDKLQLRGDGSVVALHAGSPQESAPLTGLLAQGWLAPGKHIALLAEARGALLDDTLEHLGCPRLGFNALSPWRPVFQVLPLALELLWEPLNATALFQFLSHPVGPIPASVRNALARTVAETPGIGSEAWEKAIADSLAQEDEDRRAAIEQDIRYWLESPRFPPRQGVDSGTLAARAKKVADWLQGARESREDPGWRSLYNIALNQALEFGAATERLKVHGRDPLTQDNVRRLIEDVRGTGAPVTDRAAEVIPGAPRVLRAEHAGAFHCTEDTAVDSVIWWDCQGSDRVQRWPWSREERAALVTNDVHPQTEDEQLAWLGRAWLRPVLAARARCVFILHEDAERHHPLWNQVDSVTEGLPSLQLTDGGTAGALGVADGPLKPLDLPRKMRWWHLPESLSLPERKSESFSSLDTYIHSPYQWLLRYAARIRPGSLANVSDGSRLKGNLAHRVYEKFLRENTDIRALVGGEVGDWVDRHIGDLLQQEGALLLEPGRQAERERFITQVQDSLTTLVTHLQDAGVVSVEMELWQVGRYAGGNLNGAIDLLATRDDGAEAVVDIKWGGRRFRRDALRENSFLQLATYAQLRRCNGAAIAPALSYFIVMDSHMLNLNHTFFPDAEIVQPDEEISAGEFWRQFEQTWRWRKDQLDRGLVEVTVSDTEPDEESVPGEDCLELPDASDSFNDYRVLTGWGAQE